MKKIIWIISIVVILLIGGVLYSNVTQIVEGFKENHIRTLYFHKNQTIELKFNSQINFVSLGDPRYFNYKLSKGKNILFLRALRKNGKTNMVVITKDHNRYQFKLLFKKRYHYFKK